jgi:hypothetical protein
MALMGHACGFLFRKHTYNPGANGWVTNFCFAKIESIFDRKVILNAAAHSGAGVAIRRAAQKESLGRQGQ